MSRSRLPHSSAVCAARCSSSRVASLKNSRDVDPLDLPSRCGAAVAHRPARARAGPERRSKKSEKKSSKRLRPPPNAARQPLLGEVDLAEVLRFLRPVRQEPDPGRDSRASVTPAPMLNRH